jgi:hypothetical protein
MPKVLNEKQIRGYHNDGFLFPYAVCTPEEAADLRASFEDLEKTLGEEPQNRFRIKAHLPFPWLCDLVRHPRLLDALEDLIGPDILCWGASFFTKKAHDPRYISWHTDSFFYGFEPKETITAWFSFNDSTEESGCVKYIPGTHKTESVHDFHPHPDNLAPVGQSVRDVDETRAVPAILRAGEVVFHHENVVHGSSPNRSDHPRVGFSIHYCAPHVHETRFEGASAMLLRGEDTQGNWLPDPEPTVDFDPECIQWMLDTREKFLNATNQKVREDIRS